MGDEEAVPRRPSLHRLHFSRAQAMSHDHRLELIAEAQPAGPKAESIPTPPSLRRLTPHFRPGRRMTKTQGCPEVFPEAPTPHQTLTPTPNLHLSI